MNPVRFIQLLGMPNLALLLFLTPLMNGELLAQEDPMLFSWASVYLIGLWGLVYIFVAPHWQKLWPVLLVFVAEKVLFVWGWINWMSENHERLPALIEQDVMVGLFYSAYGVWDGFCAVVFLFFAFKAMGLNKAEGK